MMTFARSQLAHFVSSPGRCPTTTCGRWASVSLSLSARLARFSFWITRALRLRKDATWTTAEEWNEDCEFDEATVRVSGPIQKKKKSQYDASGAHIGGNLRVTAALNIVVGVERNSRAVASARGPFQIRTVRILT